MKKKLFKITLGFIALNIALIIGYGFFDGKNYSHNPLNSLSPGDSISTTLIIPETGEYDISVQAFCLDESENG